MEGARGGQLKETKQRCRIRLFDIGYQVLENSVSWFDSDYLSPILD